jgi:hypothetical protein
MSWGVPRPRAGLRTVLFVAAVAALLLVSAQAALAAPTGWGVDQTGGGDKVPSTIPNDYTAAGLQFAVAGPLAANTDYYLKVAFCQGAYNAATARGVMWNAASGKWVRTGAAWSDFPVIRTNPTATGVATGSTWVYAAFGDDTQTGTWNVYFIARPVSGTDADALVGSVTTTMTVLDMVAGGAWMHNGVSIYSGGLTRAEVDATSTIGASHGNTLALFQTEDNGCADGNDTIIPAAGFTGGFRLWMPVPNPGYGATPAGGEIYVNLNRKTLAAASSNPSFTNVNHFVEPPADTDMAVGLTTSADQTPPTASASLTAAGAASSIKLSWPAATDNVAVTAYRVYRWTARPDGVTYSPEHKLIATVSPAGDGSGSYTDGDPALVNGTEYYYEVRAVDAASNIGPRSATAHALFGDAPPVTTATGLAANDHSDWTNAASPTFDLSATDTDKTPVAGTWYAVNGAAGVLWTANPVAAAGLVEGSNPISYWSVDTAGLTETAKTGYINIDRTAPVTTVSGVPAGWVKRPVELKFNAPSSASEAPIAYTEYRVAGGAWVKGSKVTVSRQGKTVVEYRSADTAGNVEAARSCTVRVDSRAPKVEIYGPVTAWRGGNVRFTFRVTDVSGPVSVKIGVTRYGHRVATYDLGMKPAGRKAAGMVTCTLPVARYSWRAVVTDSAGNATRTTAGALKVLPGAHGRK